MKTRKKSELRDISQVTFIFLEFHNFTKFDDIRGVPKSCC